MAVPGFYAIALSLCRTSEIPFLNLVLALSLHAPAVRVNHMFMEPDILQEAE
jgi:hypothetical protein